MPKCTYCGKMYDIPYGVTYVLTDNKIIYLCSSKCRKNMMMKRRNVRWTKNSEKQNSGEKE